MRKIILSIVAALGFGQVSSDTLPEHKLTSETSLAPKDGSRIQVNSDNPDLTKEECIALIDAYRKKAGPEGQVSVHKPSTAMEGHVTSWCVDNMDGKDVMFNDSFF